jgi:hypothetical protein
VKKLASADANSFWNVVVSVMVATLDVQTSLAPIRIVTYSTPCETTVVTCPLRAFMRAPVLASLKLRPKIAGCAARMRR